MLEYFIFFNKKGELALLLLLLLFNLIYLFFGKSFFKNGEIKFKQRS